MVVPQGFKQENFQLVDDLITRVLKTDVRVPLGERLVHGGHKPNHRPPATGLVMVHIHTTYLK